jgi:hypothetical protein
MPLQNPDDFRGRHLGIAAPNPLDVPAGDRVTSVDRGLDPALCVIVGQFRLEADRLDVGQSSSPRARYFIGRFGGGKP